MTISPISLAFKKCKKEKRPALITFTVAGDNTIKNSLEILNSLAKYADILELSFLHNCPIADGGQIQNSTYRSLSNGTTLKDTKRARYTAATDEEALNAYKLVTKYENLNPSLEPSHAFAEAIKLAPKLSRDTIIIVNSCGDAHKDRDILKQRLGKFL